MNFAPEVIDKYRVSLSDDTYYLEKLVSNNWIVVQSSTDKDTIMYQFGLVASTMAPPVKTVIAQGDPT
jgi:hypothetical protein